MQHLTPSSTHQLIYPSRIPLPDGPPEWFKYFLCGVKGAAEDLVNNSSLHGMMVLVSGNIPPASGLSSSSALVCSAVLAVSYANELSLDKQKLASTAARCERYIGTQGGGMDQAIALLATKNTAQYIEWNPLKATAIRLPSNAFFVIANSLSEMNKAATSDFNQRVVECRLGARLLAKKAALNWRDTEKFAVLQKTLNYTLPEMIDMAKECLKELYSRQDLMKEFRITEQELEDLLLTPNTKTAQVFNIRQRALHVFEEAHRVELFREAAERGDLTEMQFLMRDSHRSLTDLYECSHKNLDELVRLADNGVAKVGARLTGAGWGGCIIALCNSVEQTRLFIEDLKANYYSKLPNIQGQSYENYVFVSSPQAGAEILL